MRRGEGYNYDGRDIEDFDVITNCDSNGVNKNTSSYFDKLGVKYKNGERSIFPLRKLLLKPEALPPKVAKRRLMEWMILYYSNEDAMNGVDNWFPKIKSAIEIESGQSFDDLMRQRCEEFKVTHPLVSFAKEQMIMQEKLAEKIISGLQIQSKLNNEYNRRKKEIEEYTQENGGR